ncbi:MAG: hypothetical protein LBP53_04345 [Candidatus Peribacteria bacterium]|nr:hypothetical protein [Candidatus Peribacteria bacterium]
MITFAKDGELYIEYVDSFTQETKKELMTLNPAAAEIIQEKENAEKKAEERGKIATFLEQNDITTLEQLTAIATAAKRVPQLEKQLQSKEGELETSNLLLEQNKEKLQQELKNLTKKYQELQQEMNKIKH